MRIRLQLLTAIKQIAFAYFAIEFLFFLFFGYT